MAFCKECGAQLTEGSRFCTTCGAQTPSEPVVNQEAPRLEPQPAYQPPTYTQPTYTAERQGQAKQGASNAGGYQSAYQQPPNGQQAYGGYNQPVHSNGAEKSAVMSTGQFLGTLLLMMLPFAGFILAIVWACGGTDNPNRRNLARAYLILIAIGLVLGILLVVLFSALAFSVIDQMDGLQWEFNERFGDEFGNFDDFSEGFSDGFSQDFSFQSFEAGGGTFALV